jgi:predicted transcriptional regulator with HTH domain
LKEYLDSNESNKRLKKSIIRHFIIYIFHQVQPEEVYKSGISGQFYQDSLNLEDEGTMFLRNVGIY